MSKSGSSVVRSAFLSSPFCMPLVTFAHQSATFALQAIAAGQTPGQTPMSICLYIRYGANSEAISVQRIDAQRRRLRPQILRQSRFDLLR